MMILYSETSFINIWGFFTYTDVLQVSWGIEGPIFIPLYHFHPLTNIQTLICSFASETTASQSM